MKTQFKIIARGINCNYGTTWENEIKSIENAILLLKYYYRTDYMCRERYKKLTYFWLELYQSTKEEKELGKWPGGKLIATMGCKFGKITTK